MFRKLIALLLVMLIPTFLLLTLHAFHHRASAFSSPDAERARSPQGSATAAPCMPDDPFGLDGLRDIISAENPPNGPVEVNRFITVDYLGQGKIASQEVAYAQPSRTSMGVRDAVEPEDARVADTGFLLFNAATHNQFHITFTHELLSPLADCYEDNELNLGTDAVEDPARFDYVQTLFLPVLSGAPVNNAGESVDMGLVGSRSNGFDTRTVRAPTTTSPWRTIAQLGGGCSGTMIGPRHVLTVAHCIYNRDNNSWNTVVVRPGRDAQASDPTPYGSSTITTNLPSGVEAWYFTHAQWRNPSTTGGQWDWGLIVIPDRLGEQSGWMGYGALPGQTLAQYTKLNRGYPACWSNRPDRPPVCQTSRLYGDMYACRLGNFLAQGPDGWHRAIDHSCDTSAGHSGSPMYLYYRHAQSGLTFPAVVAVHFGSRCDRDVDGDGTIQQDELCMEDDAYPSIVRRNTPTEFSLISAFRELFP